MPNSGDIVTLDLGRPEGREAGFRHPAEVVIEAEPANGLDRPPAVQCQHLRAVSPGRVVGTVGNVGPLLLSRIRETIAVISDLP